MAMPFIVTKICCFLPNKVLSLFFIGKLYLNIKLQVISSLTCLLKLFKGKGGGKSFFRRSIENH